MTKVLALYTKLTDINNYKWHSDYSILYYKGEIIMIFLRNYKPNKSNIKMDIYKYISKPVYEVKLFWCAINYRELNG